MKILMLNPPFLPKYSRFSRSPAVTKSGTIYYPIWHAYATGVLEKEGHHVSALPVESLSLDKRVDAIARHEFDMTLVELAQKLEVAGDINNITGLTLRVGQEIKTNSDRALIADMDSVPFVSSVYKRHLKIENYFYAHCRYPVISIFTSRGCNAQCNYCVYPQQMFGRRQRQ